MLIPLKLCNNHDKTTYSPFNHAFMIGPEAKMYISVYPYTDVGLIVTTNKLLHQAYHMTDPVIYLESNDK